MAVINCSAIRPFSSHRKLKNYSRSTISESRLDDLALLHIETDLLDIQFGRDNKRISET